jgi:hypothetical protein
MPGGHKGEKGQDCIFIMRKQASMQEWLVKSPGKAPLPEGPLSPRSSNEIIDAHKQLRHEVAGLKLQLAMKQVRISTAGV